MYAPRAALRTCFHAAIIATSSPHPLHIQPRTHLSPRLTAPHHLHLLLPPKASLSPCPTLTTTSSTASGCRRSDGHDHDLVRCMARWLSSIVTKYGSTTVIRRLYIFPASASPSHSSHRSRSCDSYLYHPGLVPTSQLAID